MMSLKRTQLSVLIITAAIAALLFYQYRFFFHDDAYISLRYAQTFLNGGGLCWNPGERVEGYTNFLYVILVAAFGKLGIDLQLAARFIGIGAYLTLVLFTLLRFRISIRSDRDDRLALIPVVLSASALPIVIWSLGGLETTLFTLLITLGVVSFGDTLRGRAQSFVQAGIWLGLATLCRPDGLLVIAIGGVVLMAVSVVLDRRFGHRIIGFLAACAALIIPHLVWRYYYYYQCLPNTFYIKGANLGETASFGWTYLSEFAAALPFVPILILGVVAVASIYRAWSPTTVWYLGVLVGYGAYLFVIGGDHMPAFRLFAPLIPLGGFLLFELCSSIGLFRRRYLQTAIVFLIVILCAGQLIFPAEKYRRAKVRDGAAFLGEQVGRYINANWPGGSLVALNTAGSTPYFAPTLRFIDMLGLNDTTIARRTNVPMRTKMQEWPGHRKGDGLYVLSREPDYVIIGPSNGDYANNFPWFLSDYELGGSEEFLREYQPVKVIVPVIAPGYKDYTESSLGALRFVYYQKRR